MNSAAIRGEQETLDLFEPKNAYFETFPIPENFETDKKLELERL